MKKYLVASLVVHCALVGWTALRDFGVREKPKAISMPLQVALSGPRPKATRGARKTAQGKKLYLGLVPRAFGFKPTAGNVSGSLGGAGSVDDGFARATAMGLREEGELYPFVAALWKKVSAVTQYPEVFAEQRVAGVSTVQVRVDHRGVMRGSMQLVSGSNAMLNTYVMALLVHALHDPLIENHWRKSLEPLTLVFEFDFRLFTSGTYPRDPGVGHFKNLLYIKRDKFVEPEVNQKIERFFTRTFPPIIPVPGGFYIDFIRAYEFFRNQSSSKVSPEDLSAQRLEQQVGLWERLIRRRAESSEPR